MSRKCVCLSLVLLVCLSLTQIGEAADTQDQIRAKIVERGTGEKAKVKVTMQDDSQATGYIKESGEQNFVLFDTKTKTDRTIEYANVKKVQKPGLSKGAKIAIFAAVGIVIIAVVIAHEVGSGFNIDPTSGL